MDDEADLEDPDLLQDGEVVPDPGETDDEEEEDWGKIRKLIVLHYT